MGINMDLIKSDLSKISLLGEEEKEQLLLESVRKKKNKDLVEKLLEFGTRVNVMNENKDTPLVLACDSDNTEVIKLLVENGANVNYELSGMGTPLYLACQNNNEAIIRYLVNRGANVNSTANYNRETPMMQSCRTLNRNIVKLLVEEGADINIANIHGVTPISLTCKLVGQAYRGGQDYKEAFSLAKLLVRKGARLNVVEEDNRTTPLLIASEYQNAKLVALLIENGAIVKPTYPRVVQDFIKQTVDRMYPSLKERQEIKKSIRSRDIISLGACLYDYLNMSEFKEDDDSWEGYKKLHKTKKYVCEIKDGEEFREVIREIRNLRVLLGRSENDIYLKSRVVEISSKLEVDMEIFNLINKMHTKLDRLEEDKAWNKRLKKIGQNIERGYGKSKV